MLPVLLSGKRVINIDETWLPYLDFQNHKWAPKGELNSMACKDLIPKVNMIVAMDTVGHVYASLTQVNTDTAVMVSFISRLATVLTREDANWRRDSVLVLDGAKYHKTPDVRLLLRRLGINHIISGPYAYDSAPCELFFSYFKRQQLNPTWEPTGKK